MTPDIMKYPLDLTGEAPTNHIDSEHKKILDSADTIITLNVGVFYAKGLIIESGNTGEILEIGKDFIFNYIHEEVTIRSGCGAYAILVIINPKITGDLFISYQAVGGEYTKLDDAILKAIEDINSTEAVVRWDDIINKPLTYPSAPHVHVAEDIVDTNEIVESIDSVAAAIRGEHPKDIEEINKQLGTKVSNLKYRRINQVDNRWVLNKSTPLRISAKPFPSAIVVSIDLWQADSGYSNLEVSGELTPEGNWLHRSYLITRGTVPNIEVQMFTIDGASAEVLIKAIGDVDICVTPNVVTYLKHKPEVTSISCIDLDTITVPIPDEYEIPVVAWAN